MNNLRTLDSLTEKHDADTITWRVPAVKLEVNKLEIFQESLAWVNLVYRTHRLTTKPGPAGSLSYVNI